jgi:hypothetical protein
MTAAALAACSIACSSAAAEPGAPASAPPTALPAGWVPLPPIAAAVAAAAKTDGVVIDAALAFGEPARGCYAVWLALHGPAATAAALADQVLDGLPAGGGPRVAAGTRAAGAAPPAGSPGTISISGVVKPSGASGVLELAFARPPYHGRVRAQLGDGRIAAVACFANQREPLTCDAACTRLLQDMPPAAPEGAR